MRWHGLRAPAGRAGIDEPDLCLRLRRQGWRALRLDAEMTLHDAAMTRWTQWWQRAVRAGLTNAELLGKDGATPDHARLRRALSAVAWALVVPVGALALAAWCVSTRRALAAALALALPALGYAALLARRLPGTSGAAPQQVGAALAAAPQRPP